MKERIKARVSNLKRAKRSADDAIWMCKFRAGCVCARTHKYIERKPEDDTKFFHLTRSWHDLQRRGKMRK